MSTITDEYVRDSAKLPGLTGRALLAKMLVSLGVLLIYALAVVVVVAVAAIMARGLAYIFIAFWEALAPVLPLTRPV